MKIEVDVKRQSQEQEQEQDFRKSGIDLSPLASRLGLTYFHYRKYKDGQDNMPEKDREYRIMWFIHEPGEQTGVSFSRKREMAEMVVNFAARRASDRETSLVQFAGRQGHRLLTTMSTEDLKEKQLRRAQQDMLRRRIEEGHEVTAADLTTKDVVAR